MQPHQRQFLELAIERQVLRFGEFTLKSGRVSPYFFNAGRFDSGAALAALGDCYAQALAAAGIEFDMLFGPAYKGIPLATTLATALAARGRDVPVAFNRKEAKAHGEGGVADRRAAAGPGADRGRRDHRRHRHPRGAGADPRRRRHALRGGDRARPAGARTGRGTLGGAGGRG